MPEVITIGESMAILVPEQTGRLRYVRSFGLRAAGAESNVAVGLCKLGHTAGWISRLGRYELGCMVQNTIRSEGVDTSRVEWDDEHPTGVFFKEIFAHSETSVFYYRSNSAATVMECRDEAYLRQARIIHITGITPILSTSCQEVVERVQSFARQEGILFSFDPNIRRKLWKDTDYSPLIRKILVNSDIAMLGLDEAGQLLGTLDFEQIRHKLMDEGQVKFLAIKMGDKGAVVADRAHSVEIPPYPCTCVDPVGAGDAFNAGFLSGILKKEPLELCGQKGAIAGALATETTGDTEGIPTEEIMTRLLEHKAQIYR